MIVNILQGLGALATLILLFGVIWWASLKRNQKRFDEAAHLPFENE